MASVNRSRLLLGARRYTQGIEILLVCTANMCRSPMAEGLLKADLASLCIRASVKSAGALEGGRPAAPDAVAAMAERGVEISSHRSHQLTAEDLVETDLILCLAREHVREVVLLDPSAWPRTFTLKELVRRGESVGQRAPSQPLDEWLAKVHVGRERADLLGASLTDDVSDPIGGPRAGFEAAANEMAGLLDRVVDLIWGAA